MAKFDLTEAQRRAVDHRGGAMLISAGAGSGKTRVLVERLMDRICRDGLDIDRFLIITYTRAAAAELRSRILSSLAQRLRENPADRQLRRQTALVYQAQIGTIHSVCAAILRENAQLCALRPDFRQMDEAEQAVRKAEVLREVLQQRYREMDEGFRALVDTLGAGRDDKSLEEITLSTYDAVQSHPDPEGWLEAQISAPLPEGDASETVWGALLLRRARDRTAFWLRRMEEGAKRLPEIPKLEEAYGESWRETCLSLRGFLEALDRGWDEACRFGEISFPKAKGLRGLDQPLSLRMKALRLSCKSRMKKVTGGFDALSAEHMGDIARLKPVCDALFRLVRDFSRAYGEDKQRRAALDFSDLEHLTLKLLTEADGSPRPLARELRSRYEEILVDEYQDCNRVQERIFQALSRDGSNVTMVGDVKQSIYRFRLADPGLFLEKYAAYADDPAPGEARRVILPENFRSDPGVLEAVNQLFTRIMSRELGELDYGEREALRPGLGGEASEDAFSLIAVETGEEDRLTAEAEAVAEEVLHLLHSGMTVPDSGAERPLRPGDIAILLRATRNRDGIFAEALQRRGIPAVCLKASDSLRDRREVNWALSILQVVDNPRQDIPLIAALESPVWGFTQDRLAQIRCYDREGSFYDALLAAAEQEADCADFLAQLSALRLAAADLSTENFLRHLYRVTALPELAEARQSGASANLELLLEQAIRMSAAGSRGLFGFLNRLRESELRDATPLSGSGGGGEGVTITSIHGSKGLEYPVVLLADLGKKFNRSDSRKSLLIHPQLGVGPKVTDRERGIQYPGLARLACAGKIDNETLSEEMRVLYVAMTRAKQKLLVFCSHKEPEKLLASLEETARALEPQALEDCQSPAEWILAAALHLGAEGPWRIRSLRPGGDTAAETEAGTAQLPPPPEELCREIRAALDWQYSRPADTRLPSKLTATELKGGFAAREAAEAAEMLQPGLRSRDFRPPAFLRAAELSPADRGTALHLAMQYADLAACSTREGAKEQLRLLRERRMLTPAQAEAADPERLLQFCTSPLGQRLLRAPRLQREFKFSLLVPAKRFDSGGTGEILLQGVIDCWLEEEDGLTLLDYKTDRVTKESQQLRAEHYAPQLEAYAYALEAITGRPVVEKLIYFFATGEAVAL